MKRSPVNYVPNSPKAAARHLRLALRSSLPGLPHLQFVHAWSSIAYLFPGLHPDGFAEPDSGWPKVLRRFAAEAWSRSALDQLTDDQLYPSDASWAGIYDRRLVHLPEETQRRAELASLYGCA